MMWLACNGGAPSNEEYIPHPIAKRIPQKTSLKTVMDISVRPDMGDAIQVKVKKHRKLEQTKKGQPTAKRQILSGNTVCAADLPDFAQEKWCSKFLLILYNKLFTSSKLFDAFQKSTSHFVAMLQSIIEEVFRRWITKLQCPTAFTIWYVELFSVIFVSFLFMELAPFQQAYNWLNKKRSHIGSNAITLIE